MSDLIERLEAAAGILDKHPCEVVWLARDCREAAARIRELEAVAKAPLPEDVAGLIRRLNNPAYECMLGVARMAEKQTRNDMDEAAAALERLAREIERLKAIADKWLTQAHQNSYLLAEVEADLNEHKHALEYWENRAKRGETECANQIVSERARFHAERDCIEAATIERCAQIAHKCKEGYAIQIGEQYIIMEDQHGTATAIEAAIRALAKPPEKEEK